MIYAVRFFVALIFILLGLIVFSIASSAILVLLSGMEAINPGTGALIGYYGTIFIYVSAPAIIVACFRHQYKKRTRFWAGLKTLLILAFVGVVWFRLSQTGLFTEAPDIRMALQLLVFFALFVASGLLSSRFLPRLDLQPLGPRPASMVYFEYVMLAVVVLGIINSVLSFDETKAAFNQTPGVMPNMQVAFSTPVIMAVAFLYVAFTALLTVLISRYGSIMVRNTYLIFFALGIAWMLVFVLFADEMRQQLLPDGFAATLLYILATLCSLLSVALLLSKSARAWINREELP